MEDEIGKTCGMCGGDETAYKILIRKLLNLK